jgi:uncharacterized protein (DUF1800 family)
VLFRIARCFIFAFRWRPLVSIWAAACLLAACGGGGSNGASDTPAPTNAGQNRLQQATAPALGVSKAEAYRFLSQASFGPTPETVAAVQQSGPDAWIDAQLVLAPHYSHEQLVRTQAELLNLGPATHAALTAAWWTNALNDPAQLKLRVAYALSQIMVVSTVTADTTSTASYLDMLVSRGTGTYRELIEGVALHPAMGMYLSHMANRKEDPNIGRLPDENFAREVMQLFSVGLYVLDDAARPVLDQGLATDSFGADDVSGLAKVFTGWSWVRPASKASAAWWECFWRSSPCAEEAQWVSLMGPYDNEHSASIKRFLGITIPAQAQASARTSLRLALDRLASHPNTAPFISRQLIQKLVTSNPSDAYVRDVVRVWRAHEGQAGQLGQVVKAILMHDEARHPDTALASTRSHGQVREPVLRLSHLLRALSARSQTYRQRQAQGVVPIAGGIDTSDTATALGQTPMRSPSVFNFYRPGYTPPHSALATEGLVAPEMQLVNETTTLSQVNFMARALEQGWGTWVPATGTYDLQFDWSAYLGASPDPQALMDALSQTLLGHNVRTGLRAPLAQGLATLPHDTDAQRVARIRAALLMLLVDTDFIVLQ